MAIREGGVRFTRKENRTSSKLLSIVIVIFNDSENLRKLLESIVHHLTDDIEVIVIDGGSGDETIACILEYKEYIEYWRSEEDKGIYDAMNKGISHAEGEFIWHLNAGDQLLCIPILELTQCMQDDIDIACFCVMLDNKRIYTPRRSFMLKLDNTWHHQGTFYRRKLNIVYDIQYLIYADFDLNQRLFKSNATVRIYKKIVALFSLNGVSSSGKHRFEIYKIILKNFGWIYLPIAFFRFFLNSIRSQIR